MEILGRYWQGLKQAGLLRVRLSSVGHGADVLSLWAALCEQPAPLLGSLVAEGAPLACLRR